VGRAERDHSTPTAAGVKPNYAISSISHVRFTVGAVYHLFGETFTSTQRETAGRMLQSCDVPTTTCRAGWLQLDQPRSRVLPEQFPALRLDGLLPQLEAGLNPKSARLRFPFAETRRQQQWLRLD
jgi:hypothetical protein